MTTYDALIEDAFFLHASGCDCGEGCDCDEGGDGHGHGHGAADLSGLAWGIGTTLYTDIRDAAPDLAAPFANLGRGVPAPFAPVSDAFAFGVEVVDTVGGISDEVLALFGTITELALGTWSQFLGAAEGASLEVQVNVGGTDAVASAGPTNLYFDDVIDQNGSGVFDTGDLVTVIAGSLLEMQTGVDPNGDASDITINVNEAFLESGAFFYDTTLTQVVPDDQIDFYSVVLHELGHGLGFLGLADQPGPGALPVLDFGEGEPLLAEVGFLFDVLTETVDGQPVFTGETTTRIYGEAAPLEYLTGNGGSDISHWQALRNPDGTVTDLALALMNPFVIRGDRLEIGDIELALMADIGHTLVQGTGQLVNEIDALPDGVLPTVFATDGAALSDGALVFTLALDTFAVFRSVASGVAVAVEAADGTLLTQRALFQPGVETAEVAFGADALIAGGFTDRRGTSVDEAFTVTLYNPAQAVLPDGAQEVSFAVQVSGLYGTEAADYLRGTAGDDDVFGGAGDDRLIGGSGDDLLDGGAGRDRLYGGDGADRIEAGAGDDRVIGGDGSDTVFGGDGGDVITTGADDDLVFGDAGDDVIRLGDGDDRSAGGGGDDAMRGEDGDDLLVAGGGDDALSGGAGDDTLVAEAGSDVLSGGADADLFDVTGAEDATVTDLDFAEGDALFFGGEAITSEAALDVFLASEGVSAATVGADLVIGFGAEQTVTLEGFGVVDAA